jgi:hypothetical protein
LAEPHFERLLAELGARAGSELAQVQADADAEACKILSAADRRIARRRDEALAACDAEYARCRAVAAADARHAARADLLRAQHALVDRVIERARSAVAERLAETNGSRALDERVADLSSYAPLDAVVMKEKGITIIGTQGRLVVDDSVDAWLESERAQIAIDVCRAVEGE